ncbi:MAG: ROK family protein [Candidatus Omnitrophica bacterium]|nr:ROK family protein [Candidatus Omnitrophota bacterium]
MSNSENTKYVIGVDLGGTKILAAVIGESGEVISRAKKKTKPERPTEEILGRLVSVCREAVEASKLSFDQISGVGIGSPGPLDPEKGIVIETPNVNLTGAKITDFVSGELGIPAFLDNDVNVGTFGEFVYGAGKGCRHLVGIFMGTGIGGGVIVDGKLLHGFSYNAGELGHLKVRAFGAKCGCGDRGCLEAYASKTAMIKNFKKAVKKGKATILTELIGDNWNKLTSKVFRKAWDANDKLVINELERAAKLTGVAVGSLLDVLSPEKVIIGGGLVEALEEELLPIIRENAKKNCFPIISKDVEIVPAALGDDAGILGAAAIAWKRLKGEAVAV